MNQFLILTLILVPLAVTGLAVTQRKAYRRDPIGYAVSLLLIALVTVLLIAAYIPYRKIDRQPVGELVAVQLGGGFGRMLIETNSSFYTARGGFSADRGERLELLTEQHPVFKTTRRYLCSASGCVRILD